MVLKRRNLLGLGLGAAVCAVSLPARAYVRATVEKPRRLSLESLHTGERLSAFYWADGQYQRDALGDIDWVLRDHRTNDSHPMDPKLLDLLFALDGAFGGGVTFQVISGYRSPKTNHMLAAASDGVARGSLHLQGQAIDIRVPGVSLASLRKTAMALHAGGVGFYPRSDFVHVDTGRVRHW
ncbi:MAG: DUF882 domain-containing protein [Alphaproteobacteria bacterium]